MFPRSFRFRTFLNINEDPPQILTLYGLYLLTAALLEIKTKQLLKHLFTEKIYYVNKYFYEKHTLQKQ